VDFVATGTDPGIAAIGWIDGVSNPPVTDATRSTHFWYNCRASASAVTSDVDIGYWAQGSETYFFGGSISAGPSPAPRVNFSTTGLRVDGGSEFSAFDTQITAKREKSPSSLPVYGVLATQESRVLLQGVSVLTRANGPTEGVSAESGAEILRVDTAIDAQGQ
jgi:hypothetical protein